MLYGNCGISWLALRELKVMGSSPPQYFLHRGFQPSLFYRTKMRPSLEMLILATNDPHGMLSPEFSTLKKYLTKIQTGKELVGHYTCF